MRSTPMPRPGLSDGVRMPCRHVGPYAGAETNTLDDLWAGVALTDHEREVVEALRVVDPRICAASIVAGGASSRVATAIVRSGSFDRPVQLRSFGEGMNRLFAMVLSVANARSGVMLVDEFENGLHHSVQLDAWRMMFRSAVGLNVQVFATTHSRDVVDAFQEAAAESPEEGVLVRLTRRGDDIIPMVADEDELATATRHGIEVR